MKLLFKYLSLVLIVFYFNSCKHGNSLSQNTTSKSENTTSVIKKEFAVKLEVPEANIKNISLYQFINEWYGVPYKYGGKDKSGIDCSGITSLLYLKVFHKNISASTRDLVNEVIKINESELKEGDLVFFNTNEKSISHVGVYLQNNKFVHASTKKGVIISDLNEPYFKKTYVYSGKIK